MAVEGFPDPYSNCCFIDENLLYVCLFYNYSATHYHFIYDSNIKSIIGKPEAIQFEKSMKNFPYKSFFNSDTKEVYTFYRQGQSLNVNSDNPSMYVLD